MRENSMYFNWVYRPANFNEDVERWAWMCKDGLRHNLDMPAIEDGDTALALASQEASSICWEGETEQPEDWEEFVEDCREALLHEIEALLSDMRAGIE